MNTTELIGHVRRLLDSDAEVGSGIWTDHDLLSYINRSLEFLYAKQVELDPSKYLRPSTLADLGVTGTPLEGGLHSYTMPRKVYRIVRLEMLQGESAVPVQPSSMHSYNGRQAKVGRPAISPTVWFTGGLTGGGATIYVNSSLSSTEMRVWYVSRPADLARFYASEDSTASTIQVKAGTADVGQLCFEPDYYYGVGISVRSANNSSPQGETSSVSGYSTLTYPDATFTLATALSASIDKGDLIDMVPQIDTLHHESACYLAAARALDQEGSPVQKGTIQSTAAEIYHQWVQLAEKSQSQDVKRMEHDGVMP